MEKTVTLKTIKQVDPHAFLIQWSDGREMRYRLSDLQRVCPCARCFDPVQKVRLASALSTKDDVAAYGIKNVGRYAMKIDFTSGCSNGIFSYEMLYKLGV